jgi:hypothetical protein
MPTPPSFMFELTVLCDKCRAETRVGLTQAFLRDTGGVQLMQYLEELSRKGCKCPAKLA